MGAIAQLSTPTLDVEPGRPAAMAFTVQNTGSVVDRFSFEALGAPGTWVTFSPDTISLFPDASGTVNVVINAPRHSSVSAGPTPFAIKVTSSEDPAGSVVEEGTLNVAPFSEVSAELVPRVTRGRRWGRAQLAVDNRSNCVYRAELESGDPAGALRIAFNAAGIDVPPGGAVFARVRLQPRKTFWRGPTVTRPYQVTLVNQPTVGGQTPGTGATADSGPGGPGPGGVGGAGAGAGVAEAGAAGAGGAGTAGTARTTPTPGPPGQAAPGRGGTPPMTPAGRGGGTALATARPHPAEIHVDGSMMQEALLPSWLAKLIALLIALAILFTILWFTLFKPQIKSTAQGEVNKQLSAAGITPSSGSGSSPSSGAGSGGGSNSGGGGSGGGGGGSSVTTAPSSPGGGASSVATNGMTVNGSRQAAGNGTRILFVVPNGRTLQVTDLLVENSAGDTGTIAIARNGTVLMEWALANFRDLDYHWIAPTLFGPGTAMQMIVSGCPNACTPGIYYAGNLVRS